MTSGEVGGVFYQGITESELEKKRAELREREARTAEMRERFPHYEPGRDVIYNIHCAGCGCRFNLTPALCLPCLEESLRHDGPYRTLPEGAGHPYRQPYLPDYEAGRRVKKLEDDLDFERWRVSRLRVIAIALGVLCTVLLLLLRS
jgi:hypothetical protein